MSEVVEAWSFLREVEKTEKEERSVANIDWLKANEINFEFGTHKFDFWTTTGSWFDRKNSKHGRGRESLLRALKEAE